MNKPFRLLIVAAFFNALSWMILIPVWQYPDEQAHFAQVQDLAELGYVPTGSNNTSHEIALSENILGTSRDVSGNNKFTYHPEYKIDYSNNLYGLYESTLINLPKSARTTLVKYESTQNPPLYYVWASIFYRAFYKSDLFTRVYAARLASLLLFLPMICISFRIGHLIFSKSKILPLVLTSFVAFKPMLVFASTGVLPDPLTNLLFTMVVFLSLKLLFEGIKVSSSLALSIIIFLGLLTRQQFLIAVVVAVAPFIYHLIKSNFFKKSVFWQTLLFLILLLIIFKNQIYYFVASSHFRIPEYSHFDFTLIFRKDFTDHLVQFAQKSISQTLPWYWGIYKWLSLALPHIFYRIINRLILLSAIGIIIKFVLIIKSKKLTKSDLAFLFLIYASIIYVLIFAIWDYFFVLRHGFSFGFQGRYFFPLITAHMTIILVGLLQLFKLLFKSYDKYALLLTVILVIIFNNLSLFHVASYYYDTSSISTFIMQASQYKPLLLKGNTILIILTIAITLQMVFVFQFAKYVSKTYEGFKGNRL